MSLNESIAEIHKKFGKTSLMQIGDKAEKIPVIPTGSVKLDEALGVGGIPKGRIIEIFGPESSGKTTLALHIIAEAQKAGQCAFIDTEYGLDPEYASNIGVDMGSLWLSQPECGEDALEIVDSLVRSGEMSAIVIDSVAALTPRAEMEGTVGQAHMGLQARLMSQMLRKITSITAKTNTAIIFINQIRHNIGVMYGSPEVRPGGNALKFYASVILDIRRKTKIEKNQDIIGNNILIKVIKNKVAPPFKSVETSILYGKGIDKYGEILDIMIENGEIVRNGAWYKFGEEKFQGKDAIIDHLQSIKDT